MLSKEHQRAFEEFSQNMHSQSCLDPTTQCLVCLAASLAMGCRVCADYFVNLARGEGISQDEIAAVAAATMAVAAGSVRNRFLELDD
jgi:AhpD family alkylhydroperoxidase